MEWIYPFFLLALPLGGPLLCLLARRGSPRAAYAVALGILATVAVSALFAALWNPSDSEIVVVDWQLGTASIRLDGLGTLLSLIGSFLCLACAAVSRSFGALRENGVRYLSSLLLLCSALNGIFLAGDLLLLALFWELMVISSYFLVVHHGDHAAVSAGRKYFVLTQTGAVLLIISFMIALQQTGTTRLTPGTVFPSETAFGIFALLAFLAFAIDAAIIPLHIWLPDAHSESPTPVSALLSGIVVKTGLYGIIRFFYMTYGLPAAWPDLVVGLGLATAYVGAFIALFQIDGKRVIAFSTISQVGLIAVALGSGVAVGATGALLHILSHSLFKSLIFLTAGWVMASSSTRDLRNISVESRGLWPLYAIGLLSISGVPPFSGFFSKSLIAKSVAPGSPVLSALSSLVGMLTFLVFLRLGWFLFLRRQGGRRQVQTPGIVLAVTGLLASLCILVGILAPAVIPAIDSRLGLGGPPTPIPSPFGTTASNAIGYAGLIMALGIWFRKEAAYRSLKAGPLDLARRVAKRELYLNEALSLGSKAALQVTDLSTRLSTGNAAHYMAYLVAAWLAGAVLIAGGML